VGIIEVENIP